MPDWSILRTQHLIYSITFAICLGNGALEFSPSVPPLLQTLLTIPAVALIACMACHAHRIMATAYHHPIEPTGLTITGNIRFAPSEKHLGDTTRSQCRVGGVHTSDQARTDDASSTHNSFDCEPC